MAAASTTTETPSSHARGFQSFPFFQSAIHVSISIQLFVGNCWRSQLQQSRRITALRHSVRPHRCPVLCGLPREPVRPKSRSSRVHAGRRRRLQAPCRCRLSDLRTFTFNLMSVVHRFLPAFFIMCKLDSPVNCPLFFSSAFIVLQWFRFLFFYCWPCVFFMFSGNVLFF